MKDSIIRSRSAFGPDVFDPDSGLAPPAAGRAAALDRGLRAMMALLN
jgi:hypothetical protein